MSVRRLSLPLFGLPLFGLLASLLVLSSNAQLPATTELNTEQAERFAKLEQALTGATLVGNFTVTGGEETKLTTERYELKSVKHVGDGQWLFMTRIQYGEHDVTVPLTLPVHWADDTPVISVTKMPIPRLGTYTARVMIYADHYAGFWSGSDHGGHLFGVVEREKGEAE